ncbi:MAG: peptide-methionine (R)-S-oxide reductase MsrB [Proteobacteria bacterium]|nr:peptide-methionine (R)-S-oxide reductase MsrB [Pseudomonadota bacterium]
MLIKLGALLPVAGFGSARAATGTAPTLATVESWRTDWKQYLNPKADIAASAKPPLELSDAEWEKRLTPQAYRVLRQSGTEYPGTSPLNHETRKGVYVCAGCSLPSFTSPMKFDSGTGWPSFVTSIPDAYEMGRGSKSVFVGLEVHCAKCGGHHGHIFDDGPKPTGDRWCINGVALRFIPYA